jgi:hypothetical protein
MLKRNNQHTACQVNSTIQLSRDGLQQASIGLALGEHDIQEALVRLQQVPLAVRKSF